MQWVLIGGSLVEQDQIVSITDMRTALNNENKPPCYAGLADEICYALMAKGKNCTTSDWDLICIALGSKTTLILGKKKVWQ